MANLSWRKAILRVLEESDEPLHYPEIAQRVVDQKLRSQVGATPAASVASYLSASFRQDGEESPFERISRGVYRARVTPVKKTKARSETEVVEDDDAEADTGLINAFGMYWKRDVVLWGSPKILGQQQGGATPVNFTEQRGVYLLHDRRSVIYVGRTTEQPMGTRLRQHTVDRLSGRWDRFSWFGILPVDSEGSLAASPNENFSVENLIATMEALLIEGLEPPQNRKRGDGFSAVEFIQVVDPEIEKRAQKALFDRLKSKL